MPGSTACWAVGRASAYSLIMVEGDELVRLRITVDNGIGVTADLGCLVLL